eukprot:TRINITY_DN2462_c0_g1_i1.p1 TRINITY_DN2462_c0_g1~~TRINITY_DN2462_c0_g1_i1.p1  ORF type:complete len:230 (+),score=61.22 TRINITY_DN2462_c0_g1_i1:34-723(+)
MLFALGVLLIVTVSTASGLIEVACVGDSITVGIGSSVGYPTILQGLLGSDYVVKNYGASGATMMKDGDIPFWNTTQFHTLMASEPSIVVVMLGTNDARAVNWNVYRTEFQASYNQFILRLNALSSRPQLHLVIPPPVYKDGSMGVIQSVTNEQLPSLIDTISKDNDLNQVINVFEALGGMKLLHPEYFGSDGIHPNEAGYSVLAQTAAEILKQDFDTAPQGRFRAHGKL